MAKAKSGLTAARQTQEDWIVPPIPFTGGATTFTSSIRDGKGHAALHVGVSNDNPFTLTILEAWQSGSTFVQAKVIASAVDPVSGLSVVDVTMPISRRFVKLSLSIPGAGLGGNFEIGAYFLPRTSVGAGSSSSGGGGGGSAVANRGGFSTGQVTVVTADGAHAVNFPNQPVPDGFSVFITFRKANSGTNIYLSDTQAHAQAHGGAKILNSQNSGIRLYVNNLNLIWIDADNANDGIDWIVEK